MKWQQKTPTGLDTTVKLRQGNYQGNQSFFLYYIGRLIELNLI